jgi:quinol monooxygenase YgiN
MSSRVKITAILSAKPGQGAELKALLLGMAPRCRSEPGNLRWDVWHDQSQVDRYILDELYLDNAAVAAHRETPHYKDYLSRIGNLAERSAHILDPVDVVGTGQ